SKTVANEETLHLANAVFRGRAERDAAREFVVRIRKEQSSIRRSVLARQRRQLLLKSLKAQRHPEPRLILAKEGVCFGDVFVSFGLNDRQYYQMLTQELAADKRR